MTDLRTQLGTHSGTEGEDCGALAVCNLALRLSGGKVGPQSQNEVGPWVRMIRRWAKRPSGAMLVHGDIYQALASPELAKLFRAKGLAPLRCGYQYGMSYADMREWLAASSDRAVMLPVMYGVARRDGAPMGSTTFSGGHALVLSGARKRRVKVGGKWRRWWYADVADPLMDGRRKPGSTRRYPKGWQLTRIWFYRRAAGAFGTGPDGRPRPIGGGRVVAILVERQP